MKALIIGALVILLALLWDREPISCVPVGGGFYHCQQGNHQWQQTLP